MEILIVEPNEALCSALCERLEAEGFTAVSADNGTDALTLLDSPRFEAVLLDWSLPDSDGASVLREMRTRSLDTPVMILSHRTSVAERVLALDSGADDYLLKPFHMDECMARVRRMVRTYHRRTPPGNGSGIYCIGDLTVNAERHSVTRNGKRLSLSAKECAVLEYLARHKGSFLTKEQITAGLPDIAFGDDLVPVYIHHLRRKIDEGFSRRLLRTVRRKGYIFSG